MLYVACSCGDFCISTTMLDFAYQCQKKPIDSSARNPLIYIGVAGVPSGLRPVPVGQVRRENAQTESNSCRLLAEMALSAVRKNPQEPA